MCARQDRAKLDLDSKHRQRPGALDQDPGSAASQKQRDHLADHFSATKYRVMAVHFVPTAIVVSEKTGETGIAAATPRIAAQSETDGRTTTEIEQKAQHSEIYRHISEICYRFLMGNITNVRLSRLFPSASCTTSTTPARI